MTLIAEIKELFFKEKRLGLVLGSGGARGLAHIGVLKVLEEAGVQIHCVVGASAGAMIGGLYSAGVSPEKMEEMFGSFSRADVARMLLPTMAQGGITDGRRIEGIVEPHISGRKIEDLSFKFACVAADLSTGEKVVLKSGDLMTGIRASIAIPGLITPVIRDDRILVDGGVVDPLPIGLAFELGATSVIVVQVGRRYSEGNKGNSTSHEGAISMPSARDVLLSALSIYDYRLSELSIEVASDYILVRPSLPGVEILDFHKGKQAIVAGEEAMKNCLSQIEVL